MTSDSAPAGAPSLTFLREGMLLEVEDEMNLLFPKFLLVMVYITARKVRLGHLPRQKAITVSLSRAILDIVTEQTKYMLKNNICNSFLIEVMEC